MSDDRASDTPESGPEPSSADDPGAGQGAASGAAQPNPSGIAKTANPGDQPEPPYQILRQYVKDFSFEAPNAPAIFTAEGEPEPQIALNVTTDSLGGRDVEVVLTVETKAEIAGRTGYLMELSYGAVVRVGQVPKESLNALLLVEIPRMLFPFVREIVGNATRDGGFSMLLLAPFDFVRLYRARLAQEQQAAEAGEGASQDAADETAKA